MKSFAVFFILLFAWFSFAADNEWPATDYEFVAASSTGTLGPVGGQGDVLERIVITPIALTMGTISIQDGTLGAINITRTNGTVSSFQPFSVELGIRSRDGSWKITTPAGASVIGVGRFK